MESLQVRTIILCDSEVFAGTERHMVELVRSMVRLHQAPMVACPVPSPVAELASAAGAEVVAFEARSTIDFRSLRTLTDLLAEECSLLHAHNGRTLLHAVLAKALAGRGWVPSGKPLGPRVVATQHFIRPSRVGRRGVRRWISNALHRWVNARVDRHIAISNAVRAEMLRRGDGDPDRIDVVLNGIDLPAVPYGAEARRPLEAMGISPEGKIVFCASRLEREKDVTTLVSSMRIVRDRCPDAVCLIAGEGSMRPGIEATIRELRLDDAVRLLGHRSDVPALMAAADLFVLPCPVEAFGLVLLEAMAAGKAVVATRAGGPVEIVVEGETGLLVPPGDANAMGEAIAVLLADHARREAMGLAGRRRVEAQFTAARMAQETLAVYRKALAEPVGGAPRSAEDVIGEPGRIA